MRRPNPRAVTFAALVTLVTLAALVLAACGSSSSTGASSGSSSGTPTTANPAAVRVMTRNLYLGADLMPIFDATPDNLTATLQAAYQSVTSSEVDARLESVAKEIAGNDPDLVALQEASVWSTQATGAPSPTVLYDYVTTLLSDLSALGEPYTVAVTSNGFSGGLPVDGVGLVTLQDRDVILARTGSSVTVSNPDSGMYAATMKVSVVGAPIEVKRSWASIDATVAGRTFAFVATHLEAFDDATRDKQRAELVAIANRSTGPAMVLGDLNSAASGKGSEAYVQMLASGFSDAWTSDSPEEGVTCCRDADLKTGTLDQRIDYVLFRGSFEVTDVHTVGTDEAERTPGGRWPSDHAGVVATVIPPAA